MPYQNILTEKSEQVQEFDENHVEERWNRLKTKLTEAAKAALDTRTTQGKKNKCLTPLFDEEIREY
jgi:F0F1-type ATP synthase epsilon subunit